MSLATQIRIQDTKTLVCDVADVCGSSARVLLPIFHNFGGKKTFHGPVSTIKCFQDNVIVHEALGEQGQGRVLVIDGEGSLHHSLVGGNLAAKAAANGWAGIIVHGAVRDVAELQDVNIGLKALAPCPRAGLKKGAGERDVTLFIAGQEIKPQDYLYADLDGIVVTDSSVHT